MVDHDAGGAGHDQQDLHLANAVGLGDLVPVEDLQHYRLLGHLGQWHLCVHWSYLLLVFDWIQTHFELEGLVERWVEVLLDHLGLQLLNNGMAGCPTSLTQIEEITSCLSGSM